MLGIKVNTARCLGVRENSKVYDKDSSVQAFKKQHVTCIVELLWPMGGLEQ